MYKYRYSFLFFLIAAILIQGCASAKKYEVKSYIQDKGRVDQDIPSAPVGNWKHAPQPPSLPHKATRKVFVLEINKEADIDNILNEPVYEPAPAEIRSTTSERLEPTSQYEAPDVVIPDIDAMVEEEAGSPTLGTETMVEYIVEKDDTLQKISKKFYNTYSKWPKIYELNKTILKSPDALKPGMKLVIPVLK